MYRIDNQTTQTRAPQLPQTSRNTNPRLSTSTGVAHKTNVSRPQLRSNQVTDAVVPNNSHVKAKTNEVEDHHRISSISNKTKSITACNDSLKSKTLNVNAVCATCGKCLIDSNHFACVTKLLHDMNARTKKPNVAPISTRKPKSQAKKSVATPRKKIVASETTTHKSKSYYRMLHEKTKIVDNAWIKHSKDQFHAPTAQDMEILIQTCLMPLAIKTQNDSFLFIHELKQEMLADLKYVESLEKEIHKLKSDKAKFLNMYDIILQECMSNDVMCSYLLSLFDLDALDELQCLYLHKVKECDCLAQKLSNQTESVSKEVHSNLLKRFAKVEKHLISLEIALQRRKEQVKNDTVWNEQA
nr:hypothetical protein [Tanacetum cinerariifolium]